MKQLRALNYDLYAMHAVTVTVHNCVPRSYFQENEGIKIGLSVSGEDPTSSCLLQHTQTHIACVCLFRRRPEAGPRKSVHAINSPKRQSSPSPPLLLHVCVHHEEQGRDGGNRKEEGVSALWCPPPAVRSLACSLSAEMMCLLLLLLFPCLSACLDLP